MATHVGGVPVSAIIVSHNEGEYLRRTVESLLRGLPSGGEILVVDDGSTDDSTAGLEDGLEPVTILRPETRLGASAGRNLGACRARGSVVVFCDGHIEAPVDWAGPLLAALARPNVGAVGAAIADLYNRESVGYGMGFVDAGLNTEWREGLGSEPYAVPLLGAAFLAMRLELFHRIGRFDPTMFWGMEDLELCVRLWTCGYECLVAPEVEVGHLDRWGNNPSYQCDWRNGLHNTLRLAVLHFGRDRLERVLQHYRADRVAPAVLARLITGNAWARRNQLRPLRRHDDDWYFGKFDMAI